MKRPIQINVQLTLMIDKEVGPNELKRECNDRLRYAFESTLSESPDAVQWIAVLAPELERLMLRPRFQSVLTNLGVASAVWCIEDVLQVRPDLTREQASHVLDSIIAQDDGCFGVGWDTLENQAKLMYGSA
jgi:hypothetical protein